MLYPSKHGNGARKTFLNRLPKNTALGGERLLFYSRSSFKPSSVSKMSQIFLSLMFHVLIDWESECCLGQMPISVTCNNHYVFKCTYSLMQRCQAWLEANLMFGKVGRTARVILGGAIMNCLFWLCILIFLFLSVGEKKKKGRKKGRKKKKKKMMALLCYFDFVHCYHNSTVHLWISHLHRDLAVLWEKKKSSDRGFARTVFAHRADKAWSSCVCVCRVFIPATFRC